jgi:hypothetical protein
MAPSSDDKGKRPREEDHQDLQLKEEVESEAKGRRGGRRSKFTPEYHDRKHWCGDKS